MWRDALIIRKRLASFKSAGVAVRVTCDSTWYALAALHRKLSVYYYIAVNDTKQAPSADDETMRRV